MDSALKEILREEKRRHRDRSDNKGDKDRSDNKGDKDRSDRGRSDKKDRGNDRSDKKDRGSDRSDKKDRGNDRSDRSKDRGDKKDNQNKSKSRTHHRRHKSENDSKSIEFIPVQSDPHPDPHPEEPSDTRTVLMFLYEDADGKLHKVLEDVPQTTAKIFPVYVHGSHDNFTEEEIVYRDGQWTSEMEGSWLEFMNNPEYNLLPFEEDKVTVYNNKLFHCEGDLLEYLQEFGTEVLEVL